MKILKLLLAGAAVAVIVSAFRDSTRDAWLAPDLPRPEEDDLETEPVLGYDGMDVDTLLDWFEAANLDRATLLRTRAYEEANLARGTVLEALDARL